MAIKRIYLNFNKSLFGLAGYDMGKQTFVQQIEPYWNPEEETLVVFPSEIELIASSFIQGMCDGIIKSIGISGMEEKFDFKGNPIMGDVKNLIMENLI